MKNSINSYFTTYSESKGIATAITLYFIGGLILLYICNA